MIFRRPLCRQVVQVWEGSVHEGSLVFSALAKAREAEVMHFGGNEPVRRVVGITNTYDRMRYSTSYSRKYRTDQVLDVTASQYGLKKQTMAVDAAVDTQSPRRG